MRKTLTSAAIALALGAGAAQAAPITLPPAAPIYFQFNNLEQVSGTNGIVVPGGSIDVTGDNIPDTPASEGNWGVFNISSMQRGGVTVPNRDIAGGTTFFADDGIADISTFPVIGDIVTNQGQISGIFYGISLTGQTTATGGWIDIYWEDAATDDIDQNDLNGGFSPTSRTAANQAGKFTDGQLVVRLQFKPGIINGDNFNTLRSDIDPTSLTSPDGQGLAQFFADVVDINNDGKIDGADGAWAPALNGNWFHVDTDGDGAFGELGEQRDLRFGTFFNLLPAWSDPANGIVGLRSNDPGRAFTVAEPGMVSLLGLGLLGAGLNLRRRKRA
ncbi:MAG: PEP-CTERM sorting domain-containing protein [Gammaproteobacteria bacterium]|nr:PEP-CTERM sorting domain-containing protein [Gammaproteobacteria bacterium]